MPLRLDLPDRIALFPLPGAVLMPRSRLPLHIFEPRYLQMIEDTLKIGHRMIGMVQPEAEGLSTIGCAGRIVSFNENDDGRMMISLGAISRFRLLDVQDSFAPYLQAQVDWSSFARDRGQPEHDPGMDRQALFDLLARYMESRDLSTDWEAAAQAEDELLINSLSMMLPLSHGDKQALLESPTLVDRRELLVGLIEFALRGDEPEERLQ